MAKQSDWKFSFVKSFSLEPDAKRKIKVLGEDLEDWMTNLPDQIKRLPIIYLSIPGKLMFIYIRISW